jgi:hypothetical protein
VEPGKPGASAEKNTETLKPPKELELLKGASRQNQDETDPVSLRASLRAEPEDKKPEDKQPKDKQLESKTDTTDTPPGSKNTTESEASSGAKPGERNQAPLRSLDEALNESVPERNAKRFTPPVGARPSITVTELAVDYIRVSQAEPAAPTATRSEKKQRQETHHFFRNLEEFDPVSGSVKSMEEYLHATRDRSLAPTAILSETDRVFHQDAIAADLARLDYLDSYYGVSDERTRQRSQLLNQLAITTQQSPQRQAPATQATTAGTVQSSIPGASTRFQGIQAMA